MCFNVNEWWIWWTLTSEKRLNNLRFKLFGNIWLKTREVSTIPIGTFYGRVNNISLIVIVAVLTWMVRIFSLYCPSLFFCASLSRCSRHFIMRWLGKGIG